MGEAHTGDGAERRCSKGHRMYLWDPTLVYPDRTDDTDIRWKCPVCGEVHPIGSIKPLADATAATFAEAVCRAALAAARPRT